MPKARTPFHGQAREEDQPLVPEINYPIKNQTSKIHLIQTLFNVADKSGAREFMCILIIGAGNHRYVGDVLVAQRSSARHYH